MLGEVAGRPLYAEAVAAIARRDGVDEATAKAQAIDTLRLVAMREAQGGEPLDSVRTEQLRGAALTRTYLDEVFERQASAAAIERPYIDRIVNDRSLISRHFHPRIHFVCQVIVRPPPIEGDTEPPRIPEGDPTWRRDAAAFGSTFLMHARERAADFANERNCDEFDALYRLHDKDSADGRFNLHVEGSAFEIDRPDLWDPGFIKALGAVDKPGLVEPFYTQFDYHIDFVPRILESTALVPSDASEKARNKARAEALRELVLPQWRAEVAFPRHVERLREKHVVRLATDVAGGP